MTETEPTTRRERREERRAGVFPRRYTNVLRLERQGEHIELSEWEDGEEVVQSAILFPGGVGDLITWTSRRGEILAREPITFNLVQIGAFNGGQPLATVPTRENPAPRASATTTVPSTL